MTCLARRLSSNAFVAVMLILVGTIQTTKAQSRFVTVSLNSVANNRFDWLPINETGIKTLGGVPFDLLTASGKNVWDSSAGTTPGDHRTQTLEIPVKIHGATRVYSLINTSWGNPGSSTVSLSFACSDGMKHTVKFISGTNIRDWNNNPGYVSTINERMAQNMTPDWKNGHIDRQQITLPKDFAERTLTKIVLIDSGVTGKDPDPDGFNLRVRAQRAFLLGLTVDTATDNPNQSPSVNATQDSLPFDELTQKLLDETISKLKGPQAKQVVELKQKYKRDAELLAAQRTELGEGMQREVLKVMVLSDAKTNEISKSDLDMLKAIDDALERASKEPDATLAMSQRKKDILAVIDKNNVWDEETRTRQYEIISAAPAEKRKRLVGEYNKYEPKFAAQIQREAAHVAQYKKDLLKIIAPDTGNDK